jgi:hypothetical protein
VPVEEEEEEEEKEKEEVTKKMAPLPLTFFSFFKDNGNRTAKL